MKSLGWRGVARLGAAVILPLGAQLHAMAPSQAKTYTLTVESSTPPGGVSISVSPADNTGKKGGATKFTREYNAGAEVILTAPAVSGGNAFAGWTGCKTTLASVCKLTMNANATAVARYAAPKTYTLTVESLEPASGVTVQVSPPDRSGAARGVSKFTRTYAAGSMVSLTAPAKSGVNLFELWAGCNSSRTVSCGVRMNSNAVVTAAFSKAGSLAPAVKVTPASATTSTEKPLAVTVKVSGAKDKPVPAGTIILSSRSYASAAASLVGGAAHFVVPAGALAAGADKLLAVYLPAASSYSAYKAASGSATVTAVAPVRTYTLTIDSAHPNAGVYVSVVPADIHGNGYGPTPLTLTYDGGTSISLSAPPTTTPDNYAFVSWTGCATSTKSGACGLKVGANATLTANYNQPSVSAVKITPNPPVATIGVPLQMKATVVGTGNFNGAVTWALAGAGTLSDSGLYTTPYPAPSSVVIAASSVQNPSIVARVTVKIQAPAAAAGPTLSVDLNTPNTPAENPHVISPLIYGMNGYSLDQASALIAHPAVVRWGGDDTSRYNYQNNMTNSAADYYFENFYGGASMPGGGSFTGFISANNSIGAASLGTVPVNGWVANDTQYACSFTEMQFPNQQSYENGCGNGTGSDGTSLVGNNTIAAITSISEPPPDITAGSTPAPGSVTSTWADGTWPGGWVSSLVSNSSYGPASGGTGVSIWDLDNEPAWWDAVHRDVHPSPSTYDEVTNGGVGAALAIKTADPSAQVSGPVIDNWWNYFYSKKDIESGWGSGPCYQPWDNPTDRESHGGVPMIEYYLQQFSKYSQSYGVRLLDYVDIHGYFAPDYPPGSGNSVAFTTAGDTGVQQARMNGTRVFWDPGYTDPNEPQPNYSTDPGYTSGCTVPLQAPQIVPMLQSWVTKDYPGTKTSIDEYNFGGLEAINGAVVQADILGIFGRQGLDLAALWPTNGFAQQGPGNYAFAMYRNYDGDNSSFGETYLYSTSRNSTADAESQLAIYAAQRSSDGMITIMVVNKTYGVLTSTVSLQSFAAQSGVMAQVYQYSNASLNAIVQQPALAVSPPSSSGAPSTVQATFPAQSITLLLVPTE